MMRNSERLTLFLGGEETRNHIAVEDVVAMTTQYLLTHRRGILNLATGVSTNFFEVATLVAAQSLRLAEILQTPWANPTTHCNYVIARFKALSDLRSASLRDGIAHLQYSLILGSHG